MFIVGITHKETNSVGADVQFVWLSKKCCARRASASLTIFPIWAYPILGLQQGQG
jgi:hypothetical protein